VLLHCRRISCNDCIVFLWIIVVLSILDDVWESATEMNDFSSLNCKEFQNKKIDNELKSNLGMFLRHVASSTHLFESILVESLAKFRRGKSI